MQSNRQREFAGYSDGELHDSLLRLMSRIRAAVEIAHDCYADWLERQALDMLVELATRYQESLGDVENNHAAHAMNAATATSTQPIQ